MKVKTAIIGMGIMGCKYARMINLPRNQEEELTFEKAFEAEFAKKTVGE